MIAGDEHKAVKITGMKPIYVGAGCAAVALALAIWYLASPFFTLNGFSAAAKSGDRDRLELYVDLPAGRAPGRGVTAAV
jgi:hypothetical protein